MIRTARATVAALVLALCACLMAPLAAVASSSAAPGSAATVSLPQDVEHRGGADAAQAEVPGQTSSEDALPGGRTSAASGRVSRGYGHALYLDDEGQIWAWGRNGNGELGNGSTESSSVPVRVDMTGALAGARVVQVSASSEFSMALDDQGRVYTWGIGSTGAIGDGGTADRSRPVLVGGLLTDQPVAQVVAGGIRGSLNGQALNSTRAAAVGTDGRVYMWGSGDSGALGIGSSPARQTTPAIVGGVLATEQIVEVSANFVLTLALSQDGRVFVWGHNYNGAFGNGTSADEAVNAPVAVPMASFGGERIVSVQSDQARGMALSDTGKIFSWGDDQDGFGALGTGSTRELSPVLVDQTLFGDGGIVPVQVSAGLGSTGVLGAGGELVMWGRNDVGQLGDGTLVNSPRPTSVDISGEIGEATIVEFSHRVYGSLALAEDGRLFAWGNGGSGGALGNGTYLSANPLPVTVGVPLVTEQPESQTIVVGSPVTFTAVATGVVDDWAVQWESSTDGQSWAVMPGETGDSIELGPVALEDDGMQYRAVYSNYFGSSITDAAVLTAITPPVVTVQPRAVVLSIVGLSVMVSADAEGSEPMGVQWERSSDAGATWESVAGATEKEYRFTTVAEDGGRQLRAVFTNAAGSAVTTVAQVELVSHPPTAKLTVTPKARLVEVIEKVVS